MKEIFLAAVFILPLAALATQGGLPEARQPLAASGSSTESAYRNLKHACDRVAGTEGRGYNHVSLHEVSYRVQTRRRSLRGVQARGVCVSSVKTAVKEATP